jgi:hypothetical protein
MNNPVREFTELEKTPETRQINGLDHGIEVPNGQSFSNYCNVPHSEQNGTLPTLLRPSKGIRETLVNCDKQ